MDCAAWLLRWAGTHWTECDVFLDAWRHANRFEVKSRVSTRLPAIACHMALSALKRSSLEQLDERITASIEDPADNPEVTMHKTVRSVK